jgi:hypothetical protein
LKLAHLERDGTLLSGLLPDQAAFHGLLEITNELDLMLLSVSCSGTPTQHPNKE